MKACLIFNPTAHGDRAARLRKRLDELRPHCQLRPTVGPGTAGPLAGQAVAEGCEVIIAAGGDGTVNEVLNGIAQAKRGLLKTRLAVIPLGTANVFAEEIRMPKSIARVWDIIRQGQEISVDVGQADYVFRNQPIRRLFLQLAGAGIDSRAIDLLNWEHKRRWGKLAYVSAALRSLLTIPASIQISTEGGLQTAEQVLIGNGRFYGGRFLLFPNADLQDGRLDATLFARVTWLSLLRGSWGLISSQLYTSGGLKHLHSNHLCLSSSTPVPFHLDGDNVGQLPVTFSIHSEQVRIVVP